MIERHEHEHEHEQEKQEQEAVEKLCLVREGALPQKV